MSFGTVSVCGRAEKVERTRLRKKIHTKSCSHVHSERLLSFAFGLGHRCCCHRSWMLVDWFRDKTYKWITDPSFFLGTLPLKQGLLGARCFSKIQEFFKNLSMSIFLMIKHYFTNKTFLKIKSEKGYTRVRFVGICFQVNKVQSQFQKNKVQAG